MARMMAVVVMMLMLRLLGSTMMPIAYDENLMPALCQVTDLAAHFILQGNFLNQSCNIEASEIYVYYSSIINVHRRLEMYHLHSNHEQILLKSLMGSQYYHCHIMQNIFCCAKAEDCKEKMIKPTWTIGSNPLLIIFITCNDNLVFSTH